jgi:hypothetical protein
MARWKDFTPRIQTNKGTARLVLQVRLCVPHLIVGRSRNVVKILIQKFNESLHSSYETPTIKVLVCDVFVTMCEILRFERLGRPAVLLGRKNDIRTKYTISINDIIVCTRHVVGVTLVQKHAKQNDLVPEPLSVTDLNARESFPEIDDAFHALKHGIRRLICNGDVFHLKFEAVDL